VLREPRDYLLLHVIAKPARLSDEGGKYLNTSSRILSQDRRPRVCQSRADIDGFVTDGKERFIGNMIASVKTSGGAVLIVQD
jgi:hypothetical protein